MDGRIEKEVWRIEIKGGGSEEQKQGIHKNDER